MNFKIGGSALLRAVGTIMLLIGIPACGDGGSSGPPPPPSGPSAPVFSSAANWSAFDPGAAGVGADPDGYVGAIFDGRYMYFAPWHNGTSHHGEVLRYDTQAGFSAAASWEAYDPGANGVGADADGYRGGVFDGRYVYFVPHHNGTQFHGEVLRYDTQGSFASAASWGAYNPSANGVGVAAFGYQGATFDGRYVYFSPWNNGSYHGEVLRYDTQASFATAAGWQAYDPGADSVGTDPDGYAGALFDGRYVYFVPYDNGSGPHGEVLRYDTQGTFNTSGSWQTFDPGANGVGLDPDGYAGGVFDGRYIYFVPQYNAVEHGEVLRYDTQGAFNTAASWLTYDPGAAGLGTDPDGFQGAVFDGRYVYFVPQYNGTVPHGEVLAYDTRRSFTTLSSWQSFNAGANGVGTGPGGYGCGGFDGLYVYLSPFERAGGGFHGEVLRFQARTTPQVPATTYGGSTY